MTPEIFELVQLGILLLVIIFSLLGMADYFNFGAYKLDRRVKAVVAERRRIREQVREEEAGISSDISEYEKWIKSLLDQFRIDKLFDAEEIRENLRQAGRRSQSDVIRFIILRALSPFIGGIAGAGFFISFPIDADGVAGNALFWTGLGALVGFFMPTMVLKDRITKRRQRLETVFPDMLDLLLICIEAGSSIEAAIARVSQEIGIQSIDMAEELMLTAAELSYLNDRRKAYNNLAMRTGVDGVKAVTAALIQAERYGSSVGRTLRVIASDFRRNRVIEAERQAAAASTKMTIPMIFGFMPLIFVVILAPGYIQYTNAQ